MICRLALALVLVASTAHGQPLDLDAIGRQPGTEITRQGDQVEIRRGGVTVIVDKNGGELSIDGSGPAVLCIWSLAVETQIAADLCYPNEYTQLSKILSDYVDAANNFIVANSLCPVSKAELEKAIADRRAKVAAGIEKYGVPSAQRSFCQGQGQLLSAWNKEPEKFRQELRQGLAVPRPPASNPCL